MASAPMKYSGLGLLAGFICLGVGLLLAVSSYRVLAHGVKTNGEVIEVLAEEDTERKMWYAPIIDFQTPDGVMHRFQSSYWSGNHSAVGDSIGIYYKRGAPEDAVVDSTSELYIVPGCTMAIGLFLLFIFGIGPLIIHLRKPTGTG
ncbi:MAG: DUF3592 domain-containing protein [Patescibacteria group bacterium]